MKPGFALAGAVLAAALALASAAQAATFTFTGGEDFALPENFELIPAVAGLSAGSTVLRNGTLGLDGPGRVTFSYLGTEASYTNAFRAAGLPLFDNKSGAQPPVALDFGAGPLDFAFTTASPAQQVANGGTQGFFGSIALFRLSDTAAYALFNDSATSDTDYDDMVVRLDVAPVPLPAAAWLLVTALGGLGIAGRLRRTPAAPVR